MTGLGYDQGEIVDRTISYLEESDFPDRYVDFMAVQDHVAQEDFNDGIRKIANNRAKEAIATTALEIVGVNTVEEVSDIGSYQVLVRTIGSTVLQTETQLTVKVAKFLDAFIELYKSDESQAELAALQERQAARRIRSREEVERALNELHERRDDPAFIEAAYCWIDTPNAKGEALEEGVGYNGGLIHFYEYRADPLKSGRFKHIPEQMTVDGFIEMTNRTAEMLNLGAFSPRVGQMGSLEDEVGQKKIYIRMKDGDFLVAFQPKDYPHALLASLIPATTARYFSHVYKGTMNGHDYGVLHRLGHEIEPVGAISA